MLSFGKQASLLPVLFAAVSSIQAQTADNCQQRTLVVNVCDQGGRLVSGLQPTSFYASLKGQPVRVLSDGVNTEPPRIVLLLDLSGSVNRSNHRLDRAQFIAENFMTTSFVPRVALVMFSDRTLDVVGFKHGPKEILLKLANLSDGQGRTALFDSLMYSAELFETQEPGDAIYIITDGGDNQSKFREKDVERKLLSKGIRLFSFMVSTAQPPLITEIERQNGYFELQRLTEATGGLIVNAEYDPYENERNELEASLQRAYAKMKSFYKLEVQLPVKLDKEQHWELRIVDEHGKSRKDVATTYARDLFSCH